MRQQKSIFNTIYAFSFAAISIHTEAFELPTVLVRVASDNIYHGASESTGDPVVALNTEFQITPNWVAGALFQDSESSDTRQRHRNLSGYIGYDKKIANNWLSSTYYAHRAFPGSGREWDYDEFTSQLSHQNGISFGVFYAPNYYSSSVKGIGTNIQYTGTLSKQFYWQTKIGNVNIPTLFDYQYAKLTVGTSIKRFNIELGYHWTSDTLLQTPVGNIDSPKVLLSINYAAF